MARYRATLARVAKLKHLLRDRPLTIAQFAARIHCDNSTARDYIRLLHDSGDVHLIDWTSPPGTKPVARYVLGPGKDAPKPLPKPKHPPKDKEVFIPQIPTISDSSELTSIWMDWERNAFNEGRQHAVLPRYDFLQWAVQQHAMQSAPVPHAEQHEQHAAMPRRPVRELPSVHSGIGGT